MCAGTDQCIFMIYMGKAIYLLDVLDSCMCESGPYDNGARDR